ncbi:MAG: endopeptidase La [Bacteroidales bacterium]|nr:endopeptidase La [Bacteroidales bacterium]
MKEKHCVLNDLFEEMMSVKTSIIPIITDEDEEFLLSKDNLPEEMPLLPLRGNVLLPGAILPITAGRKKSIKLIKRAQKSGNTIAVFAQRTDAEDPQMEDLYTVGTAARVMKILEIPDGNYLCILQGLSRISLKAITQEEPYMSCVIEPNVEDETELENPQLATLSEAIKDMYSQVVKVVSSMPQEVNLALKNIENPRILVNFVASHIEVAVEEKQRLLETSSFIERAKKILALLSRELQLQEVKNQIQKKVKKDMDKQQREYFLNQQLKTIQEELGENPGLQEIEELEQRAFRKKWDNSVNEIFSKELQKLTRLHPQSPDYSTQLNYLNMLLDLPWNEYTKDNLDLKHAQKVLDKDHYGMEKVKERILEYLAVLKLKGDMKSPILCLVGPPGVGKTSLGKSIASALNRKYIRMALGGLRDEAEIRGHRKTYIGAMPGRVIQNIRKAKSSNPVFVLDEIDKVMGMSVNGDPASALLEVLDPEQNTAFHDNYLDVDYDLSKVLFVATANSTNSIHPALLDRMEIIDISGYVIEEKIEIAKRHLVPKQLKEHGLKRNQFTFSNAVLSQIITEYTRESGVRQLDKAIAKVIRRNTVKVVNEEPVDRAIKKESLKELLGLPIRSSEKPDDSSIGVVTGLAWTSVGGEILFIESSLSKGKGVLTMTGSLGDVMKESATLAYEYIKSNAEKFGIDETLFETKNVHIHVPEGATPKDGPSAGITIFTALVSVFTQRKVRANFAMTGEITLRGKVLPVGGIKEKILAAKRAKITDIIMCEMNRCDIEDINADYLEGLTFHYVTEVNEIMPLILE